MIWSSVVKLALLALGQSQAANVAPPLERVAASIALVEAAQPTFGVLIDDRGLFLVPTPGPLVSSHRARLKDGSTVQLEMLSYDEITQMAVYRASPWKQGQALAVGLASQQEIEKQTLVVLLSDQVLQGHGVAVNRVGVLMPSQRYVPLTEVHFESPLKPFGGAPVFTLKGKLAGVLNAALFSVSEEQGSDSSIMRTSKPGPRALSVGFSIGPQVLTRVVTGFRSKDHQVLHPAIGMMYRSAPLGGVEVQSVDAGTPAEKAGLKAGDRLIALDGVAIKDNVHMATMLFESEVGTERKLRLIRGTKTLEIKVKIGALRSTPGMLSPKTPR